jgi:hypothetical protein
MKNSVARFTVILFVLCFIPSIQGEELIESPSVKLQRNVARVLDLIRADRREPTAKNISGSWMPNPGIGGPGNVFTITETNGEISGEGVFSGCVLDYAFTISGYRKDQVVTLIFKSGDPIKIADEKKYLVKSQGRTVLLAEEGFEDFPMVRFKSRVK